MEKVDTLIQKLQQQLTEKAPPDRMMVTVQMLYGELKQQTAVEPRSNGSVAVIMPQVPVVDYERAVSQSQPLEEVNPQSEERIVEVLQVDEKEIEEELNEIKRNAEAKNKLSINSKPPMLFDPMEDVPTLTHQDSQAGKREVNDVSSQNKSSWNERLKENKTELGERLTDGPIKDLRKAIGVNDRFLFINELFRGDEAMYERSIKTINNFSILAEAEFWIRRELKLKIGWRDSDPFVKQFDQLVRRRFS
ncbi:MAG: hypothetical protein ABJA57_12635 [Ginsengibacter sp.]